jgi:CHAT domain-containing protein
MREFYQKLSRGYSKAQALQLAKKEMIRSPYSHPFFWAGYVLNGESESPIIFH